MWTDIADYCGERECEFDGILSDEVERWPVQDVLRLRCRNHEIQVEIQWASTSFDKRQVDPTASIWTQAKRIKIYPEHKYILDIDAVSDRGHVDWLRTWESVEAVRYLVDNQLDNAGKAKLRLALGMAKRLAEVRRRLRSESRCRYPNRGQGPEELRLQDIADSQSFKRETRLRQQLSFYKGLLQESLDKCNRVLAES